MSPSTKLVRLLAYHRLVEYVEGYISILYSMVCGDVIERLLSLVSLT